MQIRLAGIEWESVVDGPGIRVVLFGQGCNHRCEGCHNQQTWDLEGGKLYEVEYIIRRIEQMGLIRGVTFSGGEPFLQAYSFANIAKRVRNKSMDVITYTGYVYEDLLEIAEIDKDVWNLICNSDYLIDGPFIKSEKDSSLVFRGSRNQRIIDVQRTLDTQNVVCIEEWETIVI